TPRSGSSAPDFFQPARALRRRNRTGRPLRRAAWLSIAGRRRPLRVIFVFSATRGFLGDRRYGKNGIEAGAGQAVAGYIEQTRFAMLVNWQTRSKREAVMSSESQCTIPVFPLPNVVLFPKVQLPLHIFEPRYREMVRDAMNGERLIGMALLKGD